MGEREENLHALNMHKSNETSVPTQKAQFRIILKHPGYANYLKTPFKLEWNDEILHKFFQITSSQLPTSQLPI